MNRALELSDTLTSELMPLFQVLAPINGQIERRAFLRKPKCAGATVPHTRARTEG